MKALRFLQGGYFTCVSYDANWLALLVIIFLFEFLVPGTCLSQIAVQRDQEALSILKQTIAAGGGQELLASIRDSTETGTITYNYEDSVTGSVTVKSRGSQQFRMDADLSDGKRTTVVDGEGGSLKQADGRTWPIPRQSAADLESLILPYLPLVAGMQDSSTSILYKGTVIHNGASAYDIRMEKVFSARQDPTGKRGAHEARDYYIDPKTFLVAAISDRIQYAHPRDERLPHEIPHEILYSNYQPQDGIMAPLTIEATVDGKTSFKMNLIQVTFNSNLADSEFTW